MIKKILLAVSLIATVALLIIFQSARTYFATGASALLAVLLFLLVLVVGVVILFITFFLWQTGSLKVSGSPKKALPIIGGVIAAIILINLLATGSFSSKGGFPLALWLIVFIPIWAYRAYLEIAGKFDDKKAWCVTLNMASIFSMILTIAIFILQGTTPSWWGNITSSGTGKFLLFALIPLFFLIYILPGTGTGTVKWGKKAATILGILIFLGLLGTAIGGGGSSKKVYREAYASAPTQTPAPAPEISKETAPLSGKWELCYDKPPGVEGERSDVRSKCISTNLISTDNKISIRREKEGSAVYTGTKTEELAYDGQWYQGDKGG